MGDKSFCSVCSVLASSMGCFESRNAQQPQAIYGRPTQRQPMQYAQPMYYEQPMYAQQPMAYEPMVIESQAYGRPPVYVQEPYYEQPPMGARPIYGNQYGYDGYAGSPDVYEQQERNRGGMGTGAQIAMAAAGGLAVGAGGMYLAEHMDDVEHFVEDLF